MPNMERIIGDPFRLEVIRFRMIKRINNLPQASNSIF